MKFSYKKRALSTVIATVLMILFVIVGVAILWTVISSLIQSNISQSESCFNILDKISINDEFTCYNTSSGNLTLAIKIGDIEIDKLIIAVGNDADSRIFVLTQEGQTIPSVSNSSKGNLVKLPAKKSGATYYINLKNESLFSPTVVKIAPVINENTCETVDLSEIGQCFV